MAKTFWTEQNKKKVAIGAMAACVLVVIYEFVLSGGSSTPPRPAGQPSARTGGTPAPAVTPTPKGAPRPDSAAGKDAALQALLQDTNPLIVTGAKPVAGAETGRGNIFAYFVPTPTPTPSQPPPPPILLRYAQPQNVVAGTPRAVTLVVMGEHFPPDAQILYGGQPKPTKKSEGALSTEITPSDYSVARTVSIEVKSQSKPAEFYSNQVAFVVQGAPQIPFKMVGRIGDLVVLEIPSTPTKDYLRFRKGDLVMQFWRIDTITATGIEVTDTRYDIKRSVPLEEKH